MKIHVPDQAFQSGLLDKTYHDRLLADLERITLKAGVPPDYVWSRLSDYCPAEDGQWLRAVKRGSTQGLAFVGGKGKKFNPPVEDKMMAMTGACLRNYIDARMMPVQEVIHALKDDSMPHPTVLLIPNFCLDKGDGGNIAQWEISSLLGMLYTRMARNLKTVIYVGSMTALEANYGEAFKAHINAHYQMI